MALLPYLVAYVAIAVFAVAVVARILMWSRMPIHVRWELYPVPHEGKRAEHGGSFLEESEWWTKPREFSLLGEVKAMAAEILFLVAVREHNRALWKRTYPFHFGLYLVVACTVLMLAGGAARALWPGLLAGTPGTVLAEAVRLTGVAGLGLGILGALGLLVRRLTDPGLADYSSPADYFNLAFFVVAFGTAFLSFALVDTDFSRAAAYCAGLVTFTFTPAAGSAAQLWLPAASVVLLSLLVAYIPLTHMSHFIGKYFAYHAIRWNDTPNVRGGPQEAKIHEVLSQKVTWSADHIKGDGKKTWVDIATESFKK